MAFSTLPFCSLSFSSVASHLICYTQSIFPLCPLRFTTQSTSPPSASLNLCPLPSLNTSPLLLALWLFACMPLCIVAICPCPFAVCPPLLLLMSLLILLVLLLLVMLLLLLDQVHFTDSPTPTLSLSLHTINVFFLLCINNRWTT